MNSIVSPAKAKMFRGMSFGALCFWDGMHTASLHNLGLEFWECVFNGVLFFIAISLLTLSVSATQRLAERSLTPADTKPL